MNRKKDQNDIILQYAGWIIKKMPMDTSSII